MRKIITIANCSEAELMIRHAENSLLKQQLAESEAAMTSAKEQM